MEHPGSQAGYRSPQLMQGFDDDHQERKASLRNTVRRIFRRSAKVAPSRVVYNVPQNRSPRHGHHRSEPMAPAPLASTTQPINTASRPGQVTGQHLSLSATMHVATNDPGIGRIRSPYAVEFPRSAKLKPLDLGNPFASGSQPELQRRKTLPTTLRRDIDQTASVLSKTDPTAPPVPPLGDAQAGRLDKARPQSSSRSNRRSRSADDLQAIIGRPSTTRKRSDEIRHWRQDYPGAVLRTSGFTVPVTREEPRARWSNSTTSISSAARTASPETTRRPATSDADREAPVYTTSTNPTPGPFAAIDDATLTHDLEQRIACLEVSMHTFQVSLERVAAERSRRAMEARNQQISQPGPTDEGGSRSPIELTDTLNTYATDSGYYAPTSRSASRVTKTTVTTSRASERGQDRTPSAMASSSQNVPSKQMQGDYTFRSLYEMLADERSARRRLENQVKSLRQDVSDLQHQMSNSYEPVSRRSSHFVPHEFIQTPFQSSRLRDIVSDAEASPPGTSRDLHIQRLSGFYSTGHESLVPRNAHQFDFGVMPTSRQDRLSQDAEGDMF